MPFCWCPSYFPPPFHVHLIQFLLSNCVSLKSRLDQFTASLMTCFAAPEFNQPGSHSSRLFRSTMPLESPTLYIITCSLSPFFGAWLQIRSHVSEPHRQMRQRRAATRASSII